MRLVLWLLGFSLLWAQTATYIITFHPNQGNPGGLNTENDDNLTGWTLLINSGQFSNPWSAAVTIPFPFQLFGQPVTTFQVSTNGLVTFDNNLSVNAPTADNTALPSSALPNNTIAVFWDRFTAQPPTGTNDRVYYKVFGSAPNRQLWIKWYSMEYGDPTTDPLTGNATYATFACVLEESTNRIYVVDMKYSFASNSFATTVGAQQTSTFGVDYGSNIDHAISGTTSPTDNDYYLFEPYTIYPFNVATNKILYPDLQNCGQVLFPVVEIKNWGSNPASNFDVSYQVDGGAWVTETFTGTIPSMATAQYTFTTPITGLTPGTHVIKVAVSIPSDGDTSNDTLEKNFPIKVVLPANNTLVTFSNPITSPDSFYQEIAPLASLSVNSSIQQLVFSGEPSGNTTTWQTPSTGNEWNVNEDYSAKATFCVDASAVSALIMKFDMKQTAASATLANSNFRVLVNGTQISPTYQPSTPAADPMTTYKFNLSSYVGNYIAVTFESRCADGSGNPKDAAFLDNVRFYEPPPLDVLPVELIAPTSMECGDTTDTFYVRIANDGQNTATNITVSVFINGTSLNTSASATVASLNPGQTAVVAVGPINTAPGGKDLTITIVTNLAGDGLTANDTLIYTPFIIRAQVPPPQLSDTTVCAGSRVLFNFSNLTSSTYEWYTDSVGGSPFYIGTIYKTDPLYNDTTFYIQGPSTETFHVGPPDKNFGNGTYTSSFNNEGLLFNAYIDFILDSVKMYASSPGSASVILRDNGGNSLAGKVVSLSPGENVVYLGFNITAGSGYQLTISFSSTDLFYHISGAQYAYTLPGVVSITGNTEGNDQEYYYFYDWVVRIPACPTKRTPLRIFVLPQPQVDLGSDQLVCTSSVTLDLGNPGATYQWSTGATTQQITVTSTDTIWGIASYGGICSDTDTVALTFVPDPVVNFPDSQTVCGGIVLDAYNPFSTYQWNTGQATASITVTNSGTYWVTVTNYCNKTASDTTIITVLPGPFFDLGPPDTTLCEGTILTLNAFSGSDYTYQWNTGSTSWSIQVNTSGTYWVVATNPNNNCTYSDTITVNFVPYPNVDLGPDLLTCSVVTLDAGNPGSTYLWNTGATTQTIEVSSSGWYWVTVTNDAGCATTDSIYVLFSPTFTIDLGPDKIVCDYFYTLDAGYAPATYLWNTGDTTKTITVWQDGLYIVTVTAPDGCVQKDSIYLRFDPVLTKPFPQDSITACGSALLDAQNPLMLYQWNTGATTQQIQVQQSGTYWVTITSPCGASLSDTIYVEVHPEPNIPLPPDTTGCDSILLDAGNPGSTYLWSTGHTSQTLLVKDIGYYSVTVTTPEGCSASKTTFVNIYPTPQGYIQAPNAYYVGQYVLFRDIIQPYALNYYWDFGPGAQPSQTATGPGPKLVYYADTGWKQVMLIVSNAHCSDTIYHWIQILDTIQVDTTDTIGSATTTPLPVAIYYYPNPVSPQQTLYLVLKNSWTASLSIQWIDLRGRRLTPPIPLGIAKQGTYAIEVPSFSKGIYYLAVRLDKQLFLYRVMIE